MNEGHEGCTEGKAWLDDYLDQEVTAAETAHVLKHLESCGECAALYEQSYSELAAMREAIQQIALPQGLHQRISAKLTAVRTEGEKKD